KITFGMMIVLFSVTFSNPSTAEKQKVSEEIELTAYSEGDLSIKKGKDIEFGNLNLIKDSTKFTTVQIKDENFVVGHNPFVKLEIINPEKNLLKSTENNFSIPVKIRFVELGDMTEIEYLEIKSKKFHSLDLAATIEKSSNFLGTPKGKYSGDFTVRILYEN
ncbi:MAG: hypothetical protein ACRC0V_05245, partial [Fusobacteriaceae bacterium]